MCTETEIQTIEWFTSSFALDSDGTGTGTMIPAQISPTITPKEPKKREETS